jgi:Arc/MetJ family transcription regulator
VKRKNSESPMEEFKEGLMIDKYALDDALEQQAFRMYQVSERTAEAISIRDRCKENVETTDAETAEAIRKHYLKTGDKLTEANLLQQVATSKAHLDAHEEYIEAKKQADLWSSLKDAYIQRGLALRELAGLYVAGYFADLPIKSGVNVDASAMQARQRLNEKRKSLAKQKE